MILHLLASAAVGLATLFLIGAAGTKAVMHFDYEEPRSLMEAAPQDWADGFGFGVLVSAVMVLVTMLGAGIIGISCGGTP